MSSQLPTFTHKLALSVEARNAELAGFYLHEAEETAEAIRDEIPEYEGLPIGPLVGSMLMPHIERLEDLPPTRRRPRARRDDAARV